MANRYDDAIQDWSAQRDTDLTVRNRAITTCCNRKIPVRPSQETTTTLSLPANAGWLVATCRD
ncbi:MAG: hypothetical protein Aurels2KO_43200 [Aureliella sp.]